MSSAGDSPRFDAVYQDVIDYARAHAGSGTDLMLEPVQTARFTAATIPESALRSIPDDREFLIAAYSVLANRLPDARELELRVRLLASGATTRSAVIALVRSLGGAAELAPEPPE